MRRLLQNKWAVAALVLLAVAAVGWRTGLFRHRLLGGNPLQADAAPAPRLTDAAKSNAASKSHPAVPIRQSLAQWRDLFVQEDPLPDPFGPARPAAPQPDNATAHLPNTDHLVLHAVSIEPSRAVAVINQRLYAVGDSIERFSIDQILPRSVWLKHPLGRRELRLPFADGAPPKAASTDSVLKAVP